MNNNQRLWIGLSVGLLLVLLLGNIFSRQIAVFSTNDMIRHTEAEYRQSEDVDRSLAVFAQSIELSGDVDGHALLGADSVTVNSTIDQDLTILASAIDFSGEVAGDAVFMAESIQLGGMIDGKVVVIAETLNVQEDYAGSITACVENPIANTNDRVELLPCDRAVPGQLLSQSGTRLASIGFISLLQSTPGARLFGVILPLPVMLSLTAVAALIVTIFPRWINNIEVTVRAHPQQMLATGGMVTLMVIGITVVYLLLLVYATFLGFVLLPLYLLVLLVAVILDLIGWVTVMLAFGRWLLARISSRMMPPIIATVTGGVILAMVGYGISWLPGGDLAALLLFVLIGLAGLGATYATRMGRRVLLVRA